MSTTITEQDNGVASTKGKGTTTIKVKPSKKTEQPAETVLYDIEKEIVRVVLVGTSPMIVNNFSEKSVTEMEDARRLTPDQKREAKRTPRPPVDPEERYQAARVLDDEGRDCFPARWVKAAFVTATKYPDVTIPGTQLRGAVFVRGDLIPIQYTGDPSREGAPFLRRDVVRVGKFPNKVPDLRYRPEYRAWTLPIEVEYEPKLITLAALHHLIRRAGSSVGLGEWRPEKSPAGIYGRFDIEGAI